MATDVGRFRERGGSAADNLRDRWSRLSGRARAAIVGLVGVAALLLLGYALFGGGGAGRGEDPVALANFVAGPDFAALPAEQKRPYMRRARKHMEEIEAARREGEIDKRAYRTAYICSWMEHKLDDMQDYYKTPAARRQAWLDTELGAGSSGGGGGDARLASGAVPATSVGAEGSSPTTSSDGGLLYDDEEGKAKLEEEKDDFEDEFLQKWTPQGRRQWTDFRSAYKKRREELKGSKVAKSPAGPRPK